MTNTTPENPEIPKKKSQEINNIFLKKFLENYKLNSSQAEINTFTREVCENSEINPDIKDKIEEFKLRNTKEFGEVNVDKISNARLRMALIRDFTRFKTTKSRFLGELTRNYELSDKQIGEIEKELDKKSVNDIESTSKSVKESKKFLEKTLGKVPSSFDYSNIIDGINEKDTQNRLERLSDENKEKAKEALKNIVNTNFNSADFKLLCESGFLKKSEKQLLLKKYNSSITLSLAVEYGLLTKSEAEALKERTLKNIFNEKKSGLEIGDDEFEILKNKIELIDIEVDVLSLDLSGNKIDDFIIERNGLQKLDEELEEWKKESETERKESGAKDLKEFKEILKNNFPNNVIKPDLFLGGNYLTLIHKSSDGSCQESHYEIISNDDKNMGFQLKLIGDSKIGVNLNSSSETETKSYKEILVALEKLNKNGESLNLYFKSKRDFIEGVNSGKIKSSNFRSYSEKILEDEETRESVTNNYKSSLSEEIEDLKKDLEKAKKGKETEKIKDLEDLINHKESRLRELNSNSKTDLLNSLNVEKLISDIDEIDSEGKIAGLIKGTFIETPADSKNPTFFEIYGIDSESQQVIVKDTLKGKERIQKVPFNQFYEIFKNNKLKRSKKINDFGNFITELNGAGVSGITNNHVFKGGKFIIEKEKETGKDQEINYFVSNDGKNIIKIDSIDGDKIKIRLGTREKKEKKKDSNIEVLSIQKKSEILSLNEFKKGIIEQKFVPDWKIGKKGEAQELNEKMKGSLWTRYMNLLSVNDILAAGKMFIDNIPEHLKRGSDAASARLALKWGKYLPDELKHSLQIKVEAFEGEEMQKALDGLGKIDSGPATEKIKKWLHNTNTPPYKIEAAMLFMVEKYGHLSAKGPLYPYRGNFLWYQALGGRIGDELYNEIEEQCRGNKPFSEEELVYILVNKQCKGNGYNGIKRRSRLYKELDGKKGPGIEAEIEKGYKDADAKNTFAEMLKGGDDEATGGTTANSIGWVKRQIEKGGSLKDMNRLIFSLIYSGDLLNVEGRIYNHIKNLFEGENMPIVATLMARGLQPIQNTRKVILDIAKTVSEEYPEHKEAYKTAKEIYNDAESMAGNPEDKLKKSIKFFKDHGEPIIRALNMVHTKDTKYAKTDKLLIFERDKNPKYAEYVSLVKDMTRGDTFKEDLMIDEVGRVGITGLKPISATQKWLGLNSSSNAFAKDKLAGIVWNKNINADILATKDKIFELGGKDVNSPRNRELQRKYLRDLLRQVFGGIRAGAPEERHLKLYNKLSYIGPSLRARGLSDFSKCFGNHTGDEVASGKDTIANAAIDRAIDKILEGATGSEEPEQAVDLFKTQVDGITTNNQADDYNYRQVV